MASYVPSSETIQAQDNFTNEKWATADAYEICKNVIHSKSVECVIKM